MPYTDLSLLDSASMRVRASAWVTAIGAVNALEWLDLVRDSVKPVLLMVLAVPIERPREGVEEVAHVDLVLLPLLVRAGAGEVVRLVQLDGDEVREAHRRREDVRVDVPAPSAKVVVREAPLERVRDEVAVQLPNGFAAE